MLDLYNYLVSLDYPHQSLDLMRKEINEIYLGSSAKKTKDGATIVTVIVANVVHKERIS